MSLMMQSNRILRSQQQLLEQLQKTNDILSTLPEKIEQSGGKVVIQRLEIRQAHLDKLLFQLDNIDVQDLSGTLNLGNNFQLEDGKKQIPKQTMPVLNRLLSLQSAKSLEATEESGTPRLPDRTENSSTSGDKPNKVPWVNPDPVFANTHSPSHEFKSSLSGPNTDFGSSGHSASAMALAEPERGTIIPTNRGYSIRLIDDKGED